MSCEHDPPTFAIGRTTARLRRTAPVTVPVLDRVMVQVIPNHMLEGYFSLGLGDVAVRTGVGVNYPFGGLAVRRDFEVGFGGSGSIGGRTFGFGDGFGGNPWDGVNGYPRDYPLMNWHSSYGPGGWMIG